MGAQLGGWVSMYDLSMICTSSCATTAFGSTLRSVGFGAVLGIADIAEHILLLYNAALCTMLLTADKQLTGKSGHKIANFMLERNRHNFLFWWPQSISKTTFLGHHYISCVAEISACRLLWASAEILLRNAESLSCCCCCLIIQTSSEKCVSFPCKFILIIGLYLQIEENTLSWWWLIAEEFLGSECSLMSVICHHLELSDNDVISIA